MIRFFVLALVMVSCALAQVAKAKASDQPQPVVVNRVPAPEAGSAEETPNHRRQRLAREAKGVPSPDDYKFKEALAVLKDSSTQTPPIASTGAAHPTRARTTSSRRATSVAHKTSTIRKETPPPAPDKALSNTANEAADMSADWRNALNSPTEGPDGLVRFTYGAGLATLVCAPLRLCVIELQPGERVTSEPQIGDSVRWNVTPASSGNGDELTPLLVVKPKSAGLDTNLFIPTDRHAYYIRLISTENHYVARLAFAYPDDDTKKSWQKFIVDHAPDPEPKPDVPDFNLAGLYTDYKIKGNDSYIRPVHVVDDGIKTYIQMPPDYGHRDSPVLSVIGKDGKPEMVNYRVHGLTFIVDRLFDRAVLTLGVGKTASRIDITRGTWKRKGFFHRDGSKEVASQPETKITQLNSSEVNQ